LAVSGSELASAALDRYDLTLEQATVLAEFDADPEAVTALTVVAVKNPGQF
jgi:ParB family transcriptional regulator, chromosome partitioning protein